MVVSARIITVWLAAKTGQSTVKDERSPVGWANSFIVCPSFESGGQKYADTLLDLRRKPRRAIRHYLNVGVLLARNRPTALQSLNPWFYINTEDLFLMIEGFNTLWI
jgi:hypothetical protein